MGDVVKITMEHFQTLHIKEKERREKEKADKQERKDLKKIKKFGSKKQYKIPSFF